MVFLGDYGPCLIKKYRGSFSGKQLVPPAVVFPPSSKRPPAVDNRALYNAQIEVLAIDRHELINLDFYSVKHA